MPPSIATMALLYRGVKRRLAQAAVSAATPPSTPLTQLSPTSTLRGVRLLVVRQQLEESNNLVEPTTIVGAAALALATGIAFLESHSIAHCEALEKGDATSSPRSGYFDDDYEPCQLVGSGSFGMVMQCVSKHDGHIAAVKMIQDINDIREEVVRETEALALVQCAGGHDNIVKYDGRYEHDGFHYIVTEFVEGESLHDLIQKHRQLDVSTALQLTAQLASALAFLRAQQLIHRDLKPANIMVQNANSSAQEGSSDAQLQLKIIDFGSAEHYSSDSPTKARAMALSGTRCYWPPEVLERQETSPAMDMWALGCILYIMVAGRHPFDLMGSSSEDEIVHRVTTDKVSFLHPVWTNVPCGVKALIRGLLERDPAARLSVEEVLAHPALQASS